MRLTLPMPPTQNHMYHNGYNNGRVMKMLKPQAKAWQQECIITATLWRNKCKWSTATGKTIVRLWYFFPDKRKRDTHNTLKLLLDSLEDALIYENDKFALPQIMDFEVDRENPRVEIEFEKVTA
jgi:crossover junction endodeoxyribonuclease RusA